MTVAGRGVVVSAALTNLTSNQVYFCKASAAVTSNGTTCNKFNMANATVEFSFKTNQKVQGTSCVHVFLILCIAVHITLEAQLSLLKISIDLMPGVHVLFSIKLRPTITL